MFWDLIPCLRVSLGPRFPFWGLEVEGLLGWFFVNWVVILAGAERGDRFWCPRLLHSLKYKELLCANPLNLLRSSCRAWRQQQLRSRLRRLHVPHCSNIWALLQPCLGFARLYWCRTGTIQLHSGRSLAESGASPLPSAHGGCMARSYDPETA